MKRFSVWLILPALLAGCSPKNSRAVVPEKDTSYLQPISVKYHLAEELKGKSLKKLVVDNNDIVYILTDRGVYRDFPENQIAKDMTYSYVMDKQPVDLTIQENTGFLYYLTSNEVFSNAHAGEIYASLPENQYRMVAVNRHDDILLMGDRGGVLYHRTEKKNEIAPPATPVRRIYALHGNFYAIGINTLYALQNNREWKPILERDGITSAAVAGENIAVGSAKGYEIVSADGKTVAALNDSLPVPHVTELQSVGGNLWFGSGNGAFRTDNSRWNKFRYYASKRWLDNDSITSIASDHYGNIYLLTPTGVNQIRYQRMTLAQKADWFEENLRKYHIRYGFSSVAAYYTPGDATTRYLWDTENDALWGAFWLTAMAFKYAVTNDPRALQAVWECFEGFERMHSINEIPGYMSRSYCRTGYSKNPKSERLRISEVDPNWQWKGDSSTDEFCGWLFVCTVMDELIAKTPEEKQRVGKQIVAIVDHILAHDYHMIDRDGKPDIWGYWHGDYTNQYTWHQFDRRLQPTHLIAGLQMAYHFTKDNKYKEAAYYTFDKWGYLDNIRKFSMKNVKADTPVRHYHYELGNDYNHSDDEMAFFAYWPLYKYAFNDSLKHNWAWAIKDHWEVERPERHGLWNAITYGLIGVCDPQDISWHLREYPMDNNTYVIKNSDRKDILPIYEGNDSTNFRLQTMREMLPWDELPKRRHNANPYDLDGGSDWGDCFAGDEYLLPYWMGRYLKLIE